MRGRGGGGNLFCRPFRSPLEADHKFAQFEVVEQYRFDYTRQCARDHIGSFLKSRSATATRADPTVKLLKEYCLENWEGDSEMTTPAQKYCRREKDDTFDKAMKKIVKGRQGQAKESWASLKFGSSSVSLAFG